MASAAALTAQGAEVTPAPLTRQDFSGWLDSYMHRTLQQADIPGAAVVVVKDGKVLLERGYGFADVARRTPVDPRLTLFRAASVSKLFTWTAVMQLVEQGRLDLDADVNQYLDFRIPARDGGPITMRNLMQHSAGFEEKWGPRIDLSGTPNTENYVKSWVPQRVFPAGTTPAYSNYGASLAGYIVQRLSGEPIEAYIERHIFAPLDMTRSTFRQPLPAALAPFVSQGYLLASRPAIGFALVPDVPAGALTSSADDMAHFMIAHLQNGEYLGQRILLAKTAASMHDSPHTVVPSLNRVELGFLESNINGHEVIGHTGEGAWFHTGLYLFMKEGVGLYVSFNGLGRTDAREQSRGGLFEAFADRYFPEPAAVPGVDTRTAVADARLVTGNWIPARRSQSNFAAGLYGLGVSSQIRIAPDSHGGLLVTGLGPGARPGPWIETSPFVWRDAGSHRRIAAKVAAGRAVMLGMDESPANMLLRPLWYQNGGWVLPAGVMSECALILTALGWPVMALVRRLRRTALILDAKSYRAYRWSRIAAIAIYVAATFWVLTLSAIVNSVGPSVLQVRAAQCFGLIAFVGGMVAMLWNLKVVWSGGRRWPAKVWSIALTVSAAIMLCIAVAFKMIGFGLNY